MTGFDALAHELDCWDALGRRATLWLRDDDACSDTPALRRLLGLVGEHRVPVAIAAIPATIDSTLCDAMAECAGATLVQHGYAHRNHAGDNERSAELGDDRNPRATLDELEHGREKLAHAFGSRFTPVLVPPWNRIGDDLLPHLPTCGFTGLSRFGPRTTREAAPGLTQVNTHVDPIAWRRGRAFIGTDVAVARLAAHLGARREHACDADEPTGLLTHHLAFTDVAWEFVAELLRRTRDHRAALWLDVNAVFDAQPVQAIA
jgi:peptidoglycan/xylan/chitin deacetylase (PgdA/CDA1 family)